VDFAAPCFGFATTAGATTTQRRLLRVGEITALLTQIANHKLGT
jgi:hypothetical protein